MADVNPFSDPNFGANLAPSGAPAGSNPFSDPNFGAPAPVKQNGALNEIGTGALRGAMVGIPTLTGQAMQFASSPGNWAYDTGKGLVDSAAARGNQPYLTMHPDQHGTFTNLVAGGAEQIAPMLGAAGLAAGAVAAAPFELPTLAATGLTVAGMNAPLALQSGQQTLEKGKAAGLSDADAQTAARLSAASTFATGAGLGLVGGQMLGKFSTGIGNLVGKEAAPLAADTMVQLTGQNGVVAPFLKQLGTSAAEAVGLGAAQAGAQASIENNYGIDNTSPWQAMKDSVGPMLGLTAAMAPLGLAGRALAVRAAKQHTDVLANPQTDPALRSNIADQYAAAIGATDPAAAAQFRANADVAIKNNMSLKVDPGLFASNQVTAPVAETPPAAPILPTQQFVDQNTGVGRTPYADPKTYAKQFEAAAAEPTGQRVVDPATGLEIPDTAINDVQRQAGLLTPEPTAPPALLGYTYSPNENPATKFGFPDGSSGTQADVDAYLKSLPSEEARMAARAKLYNIPTSAPADNIGDLAKQQADAKAAKAAQEDAAWQLANPGVAGPRPEDFPDNEARAQAQRDADAGKITALSPDDAVERAQALTGAQGFDDKQPTAMELALAKAQSDAADKAQHMAAVQEIAQARQKAEDEANPPAKQVADLANPIQQAIAGAYPDKTPGTGMTTRVTNLIDAAISGKKTYAEQLDAIDKLRDGTVKGIPKGGAMEGVIGSLHDTLTAGRESSNETPATEATPTEAVQTEAQGSESAPAVANTANATIPSEVAPAMRVPSDARAAAQDAADRLDTTLAGFHDRLRAGETLSPADQERFNEAGTMRQNLAASIANKGSSDDYLNDLSKYADDTATPEAFAASAKDRLSRMAPASPETHSPGLAAAIGSSDDLAPTLTHIAENGSAPWVRDLATKLQGMGLTTTIGNEPLGNGYRAGAVGGYDAANDHISIPAGNEMEATALHEIVHAATYGPIERAMNASGPPQSQAEAQSRAGYNALESVRAEALKKAGPDTHYGLTDAHEFMAELNSNPDFRDFLNKKSLWARTTDAVRNLLGLKTDSRTLLDKALSAQDALFNKDQYDAAQQARTDVRKFNSSPEAAGQVTDQVLSKVASDADKPSFWDKISLRGMDMAAFKTLASVKTSQYIADRVRALPEMVQSGVSGGMDGLLKAQERMRMAGDLASQAPAKFSHDVSGMLRGLPDDAARDLNKQMARFGTNGSIGGYDPRYNFDKNKLLNPALDPANKAFIDGEFRDFKRLEATNPAAAKFITDGAKVNRLGYVQTVASILRNTLQHPSNQDGDGMALAPLAKGLDFMDKALNDPSVTPNRDTAGHINGASYTLDQRIKGVFDAARQLPEKSALRAQMAAIEDPYKNLMANPYYSAGREGNYFVNIGFKDMDAATWAKMEQALVGTNKVLGNYQDQDHAFFRVDSSDQMAGLERKLVAAGGNKIDVSKNSRGLLSTNGAVDQRAGIPAALRTVLANLHDTVESTPGLDPAQGGLMKDAMTRQILSLLPETSSKLATIKRMGIPGYDGDFLGNFSKRASGAAHDLSHVYTAQDFTQSFKQMNDGVDTLARSGSPEMQEKARAAVDELAQRHANSLTPLDNSPINTINSFGHSFYLAVAPAFYIRTMAQPWHRGMPYLGSRFGWVDSAKELASATPIALKIMKASIAKGWNDGGLLGVANADMNFKGMGLSPTDEAFVQELHDRGRLKLGMSQELQRMTSNSGTQKLQDAGKVAGLTAQYAEMTNRLITGLSAFRLAQAGKGGKNLGVEGNTEYAMNAIDRVMDNFDSTNTARAIGKYGPLGKAGPLATQFMNYQLQTMQQIARTAHDGFFNRDQSPEGQQRSLEAKKELGGLFATTAMISGAMGLPFVNAAAGVYNMLTNDPDNPSDIREGARQSLASTFGVGVGDVIAHGVGHLPSLWGSTAGVDTSTFGLQNVLPGSEFLASRRLMKDRLADQSEALMGPALNGIADIIKAGVQMSDGNYVKGIENALPSGLKGYYKAAELAGVFGPGGYTDARGIQTGQKASGWDVGLQATGLRPADKANAAEMQQYELEDNERRTNRASIIRSQFVKAQNDPDALASAGDAVSAFNAKNPIQPITGLSITATMRQQAMMMATAQSTGTGVGAANKRQLAVNLQKQQYGNIGGALDAMPQY